MKRVLAIILATMCLLSSLPVLAEENESNIFDSAGKFFGDTWNSAGELWNEATTAVGDAWNAAGDVLAQADGLELDSRKTIDRFADTLMVQGSAVVSSGEWGLESDTNHIVLPEMFKAVARCFCFDKFTANVYSSSSYVWEAFEISYEDGELVIPSGKISLWMIQTGNGESLDVADSFDRFFEMCCPANA